MTGAQLWSHENFFFKLLVNFHAEMQLEHQCRNTAGSNNAFIMQIIRLKNLDLALYHNEGSLNDRS